MCDSKFSLKSLLSGRHLADTQKKEPYICEVYNMKFFQGQMITAHKFPHLGYTFPKKKVWDDDL